MSVLTEKEAHKLAKALASECLAIRVRTLNRVVTGLYDRALQPLGVKTSQANILVSLSLLGQATSAKIGQVMSMEKSTVSRNLDRMRKNGWIAVANSDHGVSQDIVVTPKGRELMAAAQAGWQRAQKEANTLLGAEGVAAVRKLYDILKRNRKP